MIGLNVQKFSRAWDCTFVQSLVSSCMGSRISLEDEEKLGIQEGPGRTACPAPNNLNCNSDPSKSVSGWGGRKLILCKHGLLFQRT